MTADLKPIRNEADYDAALEEVGRLWGARSGTPNGDRLDVLATLIDVHLKPTTQSEYKRAVDLFIVPKFGTWRMSWQFFELLQSEFDGSYAMIYPHSTLGISDTLSPALPKPLTVVFSFLSRADATPLQERRKANGHTFGVYGKPVGDPAKDPHDNAFEQDPNLNFEKWEEYWRKIHGVRFVHPEDDETTIAKLLRYDQIHRLAAGPSNLAPLPYEPPVDNAGRLFSTVIGHIPPYRRPRWDGAAYLFFSSTDDVDTVFSSRRVHDKIQPEDHVIFRDLAPILAQQHVIIPSPSSRDAITLMITHTRHQKLDRAIFQRRWREDLADIVIAQPAVTHFVKRYVQLHNIGEPHEGSRFYHPDTASIDGITLMAFSSMNDLEDFLLSDGYRAINEAEQELSDMTRREYWAALNITIVNQIGREVATRLHP